MNLANYKIKKPKIETPIFLIQNLLIFLFLFCFILSSVGYASPSMLCDFEAGVNTNGPEGGGTGYFKCRESYDPSPVASPGAVGTNYCIHDHSSSDGSDHTFYIDSSASRTLIEEAHGANRFRIWLKLPVGFSHAPDNNLHWGTYTRDPRIYSNEQGSHYYHYYNLEGSPYWTKIIANTHPNKKVGDKENIVDNPTLPEGWNYYDGFTRFYFEIKGNAGMTGDWDWYLDEAEFYYEAEPENTVSINSIACSYFGEGHFQLNWHGERRASNDHHYEVRYSTSPIINANYSSAQLAPGCSDLTKVVGSYSWVKADFTIPVENGQIYYFAIKDLSSDNPYVTRINYPVGDAGERAPSPEENQPPQVPEENQPPQANAGLNQNVTDNDNNGETVTLDGSGSSDPDGTIRSYLWKEGNTEIATGMKPEVTLAMGTHTITLTVTDDLGAQDDDTVNIVVHDETVVEPMCMYIEAESGTIVSPMVIGNDPNPAASGGKYVYAPSGAGNTNNPANEATYSISIPHDGEYYLWLRMCGPSGSNDAMYIGFNGNFDRVYPAETGEYEWVRVETTHRSGDFSHRLSAGANQINIGHGEELAMADMIFVTDDPDCIPADTADNQMSAPTGLRVIH